MTDEFATRLIQYYDRRRPDNVHPLWQGIINTRLQPLHQAMISKDVKRVKDALENIYVGSQLDGIDFGDAWDVSKITENCLQCYQEDFGKYSSIPVPDYPHAPRHKRLTPRFVLSAHVYHHLAPYLNNPTEVVEIGAGVGYIAYLFKVLRHDVQYRIIDLPLVSMIQSAVYAQFVSEDQVWFSGEDERKTQLRIYSPRDIGLLPDRSIDCYINHNSFPEIPGASQQAYLYLMKRTLKPDGVFFSVNYEPGGDQISVKSACEESKMKQIERKKFNDHAEQAVPGMVFWLEVFTP